MSLGRRTSGEASPATVPAWARLAYALDVDVPLGLPVVDLVRGADRILELGPGPCAWSWRRLLGSPRLSRGVGLERFPVYVASARTAPCWRSLVLGTATHLPFRDAAFDATIALDVVEHLDKRPGARMLEEMKRVSRGLAVIMTPNGFLPQEPDDNPWQQHRSGWTAEELRDLGFRVRGIRGPKLLRGEYARPRIRPAPVGLALSAALSPVSSLRPEWSFQLLAWWENPHSARAR
jgi:hypothetical protein